jgi:adenosylhomocysteine nucleosidase
MMVHRAAAVCVLAMSSSCQHQTGGDLGSGADACRPGARMFVTAIEREAAPLRARATLTGELRVGGALFVCGLVGGQRAVIGAIGVGPARSHRNAEAALQQLAPSSVVMVGIAGGIGPSVHVGDVTIPQQWSRHDTETRWFGIDPTLLVSAQHLQPALHACDEAPVCASPPRVLVGGNGVTGVGFIDDPAVASELRRRLDAVVTDMETAEVAQVAASHHVPFLAVRAVSDVVSTGRSDELIDKYDELAADNAAATASALP